MNAFTNIAQQQQTNLAVVAPGIAEALFATGLGLVAAIPAAIFYNKFAGDLDRFGDRLETFADEVAARLSRRLSERN
jgi:biopolymer transport protein TolQ